MFECYCPDCRQNRGLHREGCEFIEKSASEIERHYIDIISTLSLCSPKEGFLKNQTPDGWDELHQACLEELLAVGRVIYTDGEKFQLCSPKNAGAPAPQTEPVQTIYEYGTVPGAHDNGIFALIAWYANQELSWDAVKRELNDWFERTNTWDSGGFEEQSIDALLESKRHVYDEAYGWNTRGNAAKNVIDQARQQRETVPKSGRRASAENTTSSTTGVA